MNASALLSELQSLIEEHGDLPVTILVAVYEYSASIIGHVEEGPLPNIGERQHQSPPERFVIEAKDNLTTTS